MELVIAGLVVAGLFAVTRIIRFLNRGSRRQEIREKWTVWKFALLLAALVGLGVFQFAYFRADARGILVFAALVFVVFFRVFKDWRADAQGRDVAQAEEGDSHRLNDDTNTTRNSRLWAGIRWVALFVFVIYPLSSGPLALLSYLPGCAWLDTLNWPLFWITGFYLPLRHAWMSWIMIWLLPVGAKVPV
jgi:hypothetical protein